MSQDETFFIKDKNYFLLSLGRGRDQDWLGWLDRKGISAFKTYSNLLGQANGGKAIRTYRNYVAHRALSESDAQNAKKLAIKLKL